MKSSMKNFSQVLSLLLQSPRLFLLKKGMSMEIKVKSKLVER